MGKKKKLYRAGIAWIARNDPENLDPKNVAGQLSTSLLADIFDTLPGDVADDVIRYRKKWFGRGAAP